MLKVVEGRLSEYYNHFRDYEFLSCEATDTRLMGVVALNVTWIGKEDTKARLYQVIHLDFSEYGVDDYDEFECIPGEEDYKGNKAGAKYQWEHFVSVMGGDIIRVRPAEMMALIDSALPLAADNVRREYDSEENRAFRHKALVRFDFMREVLQESGLLEGAPEDTELVRLFSKPRLATCETINYFIMRLIDHDYVAARYLSTMTEEELAACIMTSPGLQTLVRNQIKNGNADEDQAADGVSSPYRCKATTLAENGYYYSSYVIYLDGDYRKKDAKVTEIAVGSMNKLSDFEAAKQLQVVEYITVFDCRDRILRDFDGSRFEFLSNVDPEQVPNGWLYTAYNMDNSHVNSNNYWLNDDVYGYAILTIDGEFILMSNKLGNINYMDQCAVTSIYSPFMTLDGRYQLNEPIFHTLCHTYGVMFKNLIEYTDSYK